MAKRNKTRTLAVAKAEMDARVRELRGVIACGDASAVRLPSVVSQMDATQRYLRNSCTYESARYDDDEPTLEDLEREVESLRKDVECADIARVELKKAERFYRAYNYVVNGPKIRELKSNLYVAEYWLDQWQGRIWAIDTDTDKDMDERVQEKEYLQCEYNRALDAVNKLRAQLADVRNTKYM